SCSISTTGNGRRLPGSDIVAVYAPPVALMAVLRNDHPEGLRKPERHEWRERHGNRTSTHDDQPPPPRPPAEGKRRERGTRHGRVRGRPPPAKGVPASGHDDRPFPPCSGCRPGSMLERQHSHGHTDPSLRAALGPCHRHRQARRRAPGQPPPPTPSPPP